MGIGQGAFREVVKFSPPNPGLVTRGGASSALCVLGSIANDKNGNNLAGLMGAHTPNATPYFLDSLKVMSAWFARFLNPDSIRIWFSRAV